MLSQYYNFSFQFLSISHRHRRPSPLMMFGMGKNNAKVYVNSTQGIKFSDAAGEDEAKEKRNS